VFLHELGHDLVLVSELGLELPDLAILDVIEIDRASRPNLERYLGLFEDPPNPVVDLVWLDIELIREVLHRILATEVLPDNLCFLGLGKALGCLAHES
jgi:hypothetical protein